MLKEILISFRSFYRAHTFIRRHGLWRWIVIPGIVYLLFFIVGAWFYIQSANRFVQYIFVEIGVRHWLEGHGQGLIRFLFLFGQIVLQLVLLLFYFSWFKYFFLIVGSPVFAYLSEKTESILLNNEYPFSFSRLLSDAWRGIRISVRNAFWQTLFTIFLLLLAFIPLIGWIAPLISLMVECYYLGFAMLDYTNERRGYGVARSFEYINRHKGLAIGNGIAFYLLLLIPVAGWVVAPGYAVVAATVSMNEQAVADEF